MFEILNNEEIKKEIDKETEKTSHWTFGYMSEYKAIAKAQRDKDIRDVVRNLRRTLTPNKKAYDLINQKADEYERQINVKEDS